MTKLLCVREHFIPSQTPIILSPFQVFLGQKYGYRPIPTIIPAVEFEMIGDVVKESKEDYDLMMQWYKRDDNQVPPIYILQPISSILTNFNNKVISIFLNLGAQNNSKNYHCN